MLFSGYLMFGQLLCLQYTLPSFFVYPWVNSFHLSFFLYNPGFKWLWMAVHHEKDIFSIWFVVVISNMCVWTSSNILDVSNWQALHLKCSGTWDWTLVCFVVWVFLKWLANSSLLWNVLEHRRQLCVSLCWLWTCSSTFDSRLLL